MILRRGCALVYIGICDDVDEERQTIYNRCEEQGNDVIDLLFLDMKMPGISGRKTRLY